MKYSYVVPITENIGANNIMQRVGGTKHEQSTSSIATTRMETTCVATAMVATACNKDGDSAHLSMPSTRSAYLNSQETSLYLQKSGYKVRIMQFNTRIHICTYVYMLAHIHVHLGSSGT